MGDWFRGLLLASPRNRSLDVQRLFFELERRVPVDFLDDELFFEDVRFDEPPDRLLLFRPVDFREVLPDDFRDPDLPELDLRALDFFDVDLRGVDFFDEDRLEEDFFELDFDEDFFAAGFFDDDFLLPDLLPDDFFEDDFLDDDFFEDDFFDEPPDELPELFVRPSSERCLFTVRAAISFARFVDLP